MKIITEFNPFELGHSGFIAANPEQMRAKLFRARALGALAGRLEADLDQTLLIKSIWEATRNGLRPSRKRMHREASDLHVPLLEAGRLSRQRARLWQRDALDNMISAKVASIEATTAETSSREGASELLALAGLRGVKRIIRTATHDIGVRSAFIANGLEADIIDATEIHTINGKVKGYRPETVTHDLDKDRVRNSSHAQVVAETQWAFVIGDRISDTRMTSDLNDIRICVDGRVASKDGPELSAFLKANLTRTAQYPHPFDAVNCKDDLYGVLSLFNWVTTPIDEPVPILMLPDQTVKSNGLIVVGSGQFPATGVDPFFV
jgi:hypothetical protein